MERRILQDLRGEVPQRAEYQLDVLPGIAFETGSNLLNGELQSEAAAEVGTVCACSRENATVASVAAANEEKMRRRRMAMEWPFTVRFK